MARPAKSAKPAKISTTYKGKYKGKYRGNSVYNALYMSFLVSGNSLRDFFLRDFLRGFCSAWFFMRNLSFPICVYIERLS